MGPGLESARRWRETTSLASQLRFSRRHSTRGKAFGNLFLSSNSPLSRARYLKRHVGTLVNLVCTNRAEDARKFVESSDSPTRGVIASGLTFRRFRKESRYEERIPSRRRSWEAKIHSEVSGDRGTGGRGAVGVAHG